jgi:hypothetical protein
MNDKTVAPYWWPTPQGALAFILVASMVAVIFTLIFHPIPDNSDVLKMLLGALATVGFASVIAYYYGSSPGSKDKDDTIKTMATNLVAPTNGNGNGAAAGDAAAQH